MSKFDNSRNLYPHEVFISYRRQEGWQLAMLVCQMLEARGVTAFYDQKVLPDYVGEINWKEAIEYNLKHCEIFVPIVDGKTLFYCGGKKDRNNQWPKNDNMWDEMEYVLDFNKTHDPKDNKRIVPIIADGYLEPESRPLKPGEDDTEVGVWGKTQAQKKKYFGFYNDIILKENIFLEAKHGYVNLQTYVDKIISMINEKHPEIESNYNNDEYAHRGGHEEEDEKEMARLIKQANNKIEDCKSVIDNQLCEIDGDVYALDVGCASGHLTNRILGQFDNVKYILGVDNSENYIKIANEKYGRKTSSQKFEFIRCDITQPEFRNLLKKTCEANDHKFNFVNISYVLMHIASPAEVIKTISEFMEPGGHICIRDVDDKISLQYATSVSVYAKQENSTIEKYSNIYIEVAASGYRFVGRSIFGMLNTAFKDINIKLAYAPSCDIKWTQEGALKDFNETAKMVNKQLESETIRISEWAKFKKYSKWMNDHKKEIIQILTHDDFFSLYVDLFFTGIKK